jgi:hypothetical protein
MGDNDHDMCDYERQAMKSRAELNSAIARLEGELKQGFADL